MWAQGGPAPLCTAASDHGHDYSCVPEHYYHHAFPFRSCYYGRVMVAILFTILFVILIVIMFSTNGIMNTFAILNVREERKCHLSSSPCIFRL